MNLTGRIIGISLGVMLLSRAGLAAEPAEVDQFVKARIEIGEMMTSYVQGGERLKEDQRSSPEQMKEMEADDQRKGAHALGEVRCDGGEVSQVQSGGLRR